VFTEIDLSLIRIEKNCSFDFFFLLEVMVITGGTHETVVAWQLNHPLRSHNFVLMRGDNYKIWFVLRI
jgi:hypothetical protein